MDVNALEQTILSDIQNGKKPMMVVATLGTTNSLAFDPLFEIGNICKNIIYGYVWMLLIQVVHLFCPNINTY